MKTAQGGDGGLLHRAPPAPPPHLSEQLGVLLGGGGGGRSLSLLLLLELQIGFCGWPFSLSRNNYKPSVLMLVSRGREMKVWPLCGSSWLKQAQDPFSLMLLFY